MLRTKEKGENDEIWKQEGEIGPDTLKPEGYELGGRQGTQTRVLLQNIVTNLAEAKKGEMNAAAQYKRLGAAIERSRGGRILPPRHTRSALP